MGNNRKFQIQINEPQYFISDNFSRAIKFNFDNTNIVGEVLNIKIGLGGVEGEISFSKNREDLRALFDLHLIDVSYGCIYGCKGREIIELSIKVIYD